MLTLVTYRTYYLCCFYTHILQVLGDADVDCSSAYEAVERSHSGCLHALLQQPDDVAAVLQLDDDQQTCLHQVQHFTAYCTATTAALLEGLTQQQQLTAVVNRTDSSGHTALRRTVVNQGDCTRVCHSCMRLLVAAGADIIEDEWQTDILAEVISETTMCNNSSIHAELTVQALVQRGLDVEQRDSEGLTRLQQLVKCLIESFLTAADLTSVTASIRALLANGANAMATDSNGYTPLHVLTDSMEDEYGSFAREDELWSCRNEAAIRAIYDSAGAACLAAAKNSRACTPLHLAVQWPDYVQLLLTLGADVHAVNGIGETALHMAAEHGAVLSVQLLLDAGASVSATTTATGVQPLHCAARKCKWQVCRLLIDRGANVNATSINSGISVTRCALRCCESTQGRWSEPEWQCVRLLVEAGADVQHYCEQWGTLLHGSAAIKCAAVTQYLLGKLLPQHPDVLNKVDVYGKTALCLAVACGNTAVVKLLLASGAAVQIDDIPLLHKYLKDDSSSMNLETCSMLLDASANVMQLDGAG
jgi:ankyrin repeat protein